MVRTKYQFWARVDKSEGPDACWRWKKCCNEDGYGQLAFKGKLTQAHRVAYRLSKGKIPKGLWVLHKCDNPPCCNPKHLYVGNHQDNMNDMIKRGRHKGELSGNAKLTRRSVKKIRIWYIQKRYTQQELADMFHISQPVISEVVNRRTWSHVK